jgi:hypothetical protein
MSDVRAFAKNLRHRLGIGTEWRFCQPSPGAGILLVPVPCTEEEWLAKHSPDLAAIEVEHSNDRSQE